MTAPLLIPLALLASSPAAAPLPTPDGTRVCAGPVGETAGSVLPADQRWITSLQTALLLSAHELRGRQIAIRDVRVSTVDGAGFWIGTERDECRLYVTPAEGPLIRVTPGELIDLQGEFRVPARRDARGQAEPPVYVYAYIVRQAPIPYH